MLLSFCRASSFWCGCPFWLPICLACGSSPAADSGPFPSFWLADTTRLLILLSPLFPVPCRHPWPVLYRGSCLCCCLTGLLARGILTSSWICRLHFLSSLLTFTILPPGQGLIASWFLCPVGFHSLEGCSRQLRESMCKHCFPLAISVNSPLFCLLVPLVWSRLFVLHYLDVLIAVLSQAVLVLFCSRLPCKDLRVTEHTQTVEIGVLWSSQSSGAPRSVQAACHTSTKVSPTIPVSTTDMWGVAFHMHPHPLSWMAAPGPVTGL